METKRVLWLNNHEVFFDGEVNLLKQSGYEIFIPKKVPDNIDFSITYDFDSTLSLDKDFLYELNDTNFYTGEVCPELMKEINRHFSVCVVSLDKNALKLILNLFEGVICFRQEAGQKASMTQTIVNKLGLAYLKRIEELGERFIYLPCEKEWLEKESKYIKTHYAIVPLYINHIVRRKKKTEKKEIIIFLTDFMTEDIQNQKELLSEHTESIILMATGERWLINEAGKQILVSSEYVFSLLYKTKAILCFNKTNIQIKQVVIQALKQDIPIFGMGTEIGFLGDLQVYFVKSVGVFLKKLENQKENKKILSQQNSALDTYKKLCKKQNVLHILKNIKYRNEEKIESYRRWKIAIVMPEFKSFSQLNRIIDLVLGIKKGIDNLDKSIRVVFAYPAGQKELLYKYLIQLEENDVETREFFFETIGVGREQEIYNIMGYALTASVSGKLMLNDGMNYFGDCDHILYTSDHIPGVIFSLQSYSVLIDGCLQRYIPSLLGISYEKNWIDFVRNADVVYTWTEATKADCVQYVGVSKDVVKVLPPIFTKFHEKVNLKEVSKKKYFVWEVGTNYVDNAILVALDIYYQKGGTLSCYILGEKLGAEELRKRKTTNPIFASLVNYLKQNKYMRMHTTFFENSNQQEQYKLISGADFFLMSNIVEENYNRLYDALFCNTVVVSNNKPSLQEFSEMFNGNISTYESVSELVTILENMDIKKEVLFEGDVDKHTLNNKLLCIELYNKICSRYLL